MVLRTLSKAFGLAGARVGSLIAAPEIVALLAKVIPPYSIPQLTIEAVLATLAPPQLAIQRERVAQVRAERERLRAALATARSVQQDLAQRRQLPAGRLRRCRKRRSPRRAMRNC